MTKSHDIELNNVSLNVEEILNQIKDSTDKEIVSGILDLKDKEKEYNFRGVNK